MGDDIRYGVIAGVGDELGDAGHACWVRGFSGVSNFRINIDITANVCSSSSDAVQPLHSGVNLPTSSRPCGVLQAVYLVVEEILGGGGERRGWNQIESNG